MYAVCVCVCVTPLTSMSIKTESNKLMLTIKDLQFIKLFLAVKHLHIDVDGVTCHDKVICNYIGKNKQKKLQKILYYDTDLCDFPHMLSGGVYTQCKYNCSQKILLHAMFASTWNHVQQPWACLAIGVVAGKTRA